MAARGEDIDMDPVQAKRTHPDSTTNEKSLTKMARSHNSTMPDHGFNQEWLPNPDTNVRYFKTNQAHKSTFKTQKAFYLEISNEDFWIAQTWDGGHISDVEWKNMFALCRTPYYYLPWWYICWYLHQGEYRYLTTQTSKARIKSSSFQVNVVGHRLPFTTNDTSSSVANSLVDQTFDIFKGMNKVWPNYPQFRDYPVDEPNYFNTLQKLTALLYGNPASHTTDFQHAASFLGAAQKYMDYPFLAHLTKMTHYTDVTNKKNYVTSHQDYSTFPDFAKLKYADADLKLFRGPVATINYKPKHGYLHVAPSILDNAVWSEKDGVAGSTSILRPTAVQRNQYNYSYSVGFAKEFAVFKSGFEQGDYNWYNSTDLEVMRNIVGKEVPEPKYEDLWVGVRPVYNGSKIQAGICQLEIRTEIEIEYETFWPAPVTSKWKANGIDIEKDYLKNTTNTNTGMTNETDLLLRSQQILIPLDRPKNVPTIATVTI